MGNPAALQSTVPGCVLEQPHGSDVVLSNVVFGAPHCRVPEVEWGCIGQERNHACKVLYEEAVEDLLEEALEAGQLGVPQQPKEVLVEYHLLRRARWRIVECNFLRIRHQPLHLHR